MPDSCFPVPCPVCGSGDEHEQWRSRIKPTDCGDLCPHPSEPGHGTGCCCAGYSTPRFGPISPILPVPVDAPAGDAVSSPLPLYAEVVRRVMALEAEVERLRHPLFMVQAPQISEEDTARFREEYGKALAGIGAEPWELKVYEPPRVLDPEMVRQLLRECVTVVKPGEVLFLRCPADFTPTHIRDLQEAVSEWLEYNALEVRVLAVPWVEMAVAEAPPGE
jgi:hypothetical protein